MVAVDGDDARPPAARRSLPDAAATCRAGRRSPLDVGGSHAPGQLAEGISQAGLQGGGAPAGTGAVAPAEGRVAGGVRTMERLRGCAAARRAGPSAPAGRGHLVADAPGGGARANAASRIGPGGRVAGALGLASVADVDQRLLAQV